MVQTTQPIQGSSPSQPEVVNVSSPSPPSMIEEVSVPQPIQEYILLDFSTNINQTSSAANTLLQALPSHATIDKQNGFKTVKAFNDILITHNKYLSLLLHHLFIS
jgi:hypothetical protein